VFEVYNKTVQVEKGIGESARKAIVRACAETEAEAKQEITRQVYSGTDTKARGKGGPTGAARASIYFVAPGKDGYSKGISEAQAKASSRGKSIEVFPEVQITHNEHTPEGIVTCGVCYGFFIEFGTTGVHVSIPPRPFMTPAAAKVGPQFEKWCLDLLKAELK
jgi:hypothetical protein